MPSVAFNVTVTPFAPAGDDRFTANGTVSPMFSLTVDGSRIDPGAPTVTFIVAFGIVGTSFGLAVTTTCPTATPVTWNDIVCWFAGMVIDAGTLAIVGSLELRFTVRPFGGGAESVRPTACFVDGASAIESELKLSAAPTCTVTLEGVRPVAEAVIVADPKSMPLTST